MEALRASPGALRERIVAVAGQLLAGGGAEAVSTRAVCLAAGVQAPTLYRLFGDKQGLLDALVVHGFEQYLAVKTVREHDADAVENLRAGWDTHVAFGLANPALYTLMCADPVRRASSPAFIAAFAVLVEHIRRVAEAGRLSVSEQLAAQLVSAAGTGTTMALIAQTESRRDLALSRLSRESVIRAITNDIPPTTPPGPVGAAVALRALLPSTSALTDGERVLLEEWLDRIARG